MIKIMSVEIDGFIVPSQKVKLDFVDSNVVCIYGDNGSGKTSFLEILFAVFARNNQKLKEFKVKKISIQFNSKSVKKIELEQLTDKIDKKLSEYQEDISIIEKEIDSLSSQISHDQKEINKFESNIKEIERNQEHEKFNLLKDDPDLKSIFLEIKRKYKEKEKLLADIHGKEKDKLSTDEEQVNLALIDQEVKDLKSKQAILKDKKLGRLDNYFSLSKYGEDIDEAKGNINLLKENIDRLKKDLNNEKISKSENENKIKDLEKQKYDINNTKSTQMVVIEEKEDKYQKDDYYFWDQFDFSMLSQSSSIFLGIGRGIHKKETYFPRRMLWSFFNIHRELNEGLKLSSKDIDDLTDKLVDYLRENKSKEHFDIEEKDKQKNIYLPNIEIDTVEQLLVNKYKRAIVESDKKITQSLSNISMSLFNGDMPKEFDMNIDILKNDLFENKDLIFEVLRDNKNYKSYFIDKIISIFDNLENNSDYLTEIDDVSKTILLNMVQILENENKIFKQLQVFRDEYNNFLSPSADKSLIINQDGVFIMPSKHSLQKLSSGERHLLTFLATILLLGEEQDFILLDEPEISLDIEWQEKLLSTISKLAPESQIIVASHSPSIMGDYFDESVEITLCEES